MSIVMALLGWIIGTTIAAILGVALFLIFADDFGSTASWSLGEAALGFVGGAAGVILGFVVGDWLEETQ